MPIKLKADRPNLRWGLKSRIDGNLWSVPVVYVFVAVPHTVNQISLKKGENMQLLIYKYTLYYK